MPFVAFPALFLAHLMSINMTKIFYKANKENQLADRQLIALSGGGSSTNFMMYSGAKRPDFDP
jgi:hypothetical protein